MADPLTRDDLKTAVVIPAYNEAETIGELVRRARRHADVCVVDDASTDGTGALAESNGCTHCVRHQTNTHIAGGILSGFHWALGAGYDRCVTMDAGLSHDPDGIPAFMRHGRADLVLGYRAARDNVPWYRQGLSWGANRLMNLALPGQFWPGRGAGLRDATSGYRMYSRRAMQLLVDAQMQSRTFDFHIEALAYIYRAGFTIEEEPIRYAFTNSSLRPTIVVDALKTCGRIWVTELR